MIDHFCYSCKYSSGVETLNNYSIKPFYFFLIISFLGFCGCDKKLLIKDDSHPHYSIGFSQCTSGDLWRQIMNREMAREASLFPEITLTIKDGQQNNQKQIADIQQLIEQRVDLLIVSPNEAAPITPVVEQAHRSGIPVVLIDRKISSAAYTAYIGGDNVAIGREAGNHIQRLLKGKGKILEIWGLKGSSPAVERHKGFAEIIESSLGIKIIDGGDGQWLSEVSEQLAEQAFAKHSDIDLVYAHNDVMAFGAKKVAQRKGIEKQIRFIGIDALPTEDGGIQMVLDGVLDATLLYPTGGEVAIQTAMKILKNEPFDREITLETVLVDTTNARVLKLQTDQILNQQDKIEAQQEILDQQLLKYETQQERFIITLVGFGVVLIVVFFIVRAYWLIKKINIELAEKNEAINQQKEELSLQRDQLVEMHQKVKEVNDLKIQFFTNISHEFRTPLTLILGTLDQLKQSNKGNGGSHKKMRLMQRNAERLLRLINQLMDFRKLDEGKMLLKACKHDIVSFIEDICQAFDVMAELKQIALTFNYQNEKIDVWFEDEKIDKVIFNLLSNAFKFTPEGGCIAVTVRCTMNTDIETQTQEFVEIAVRDNGIGIPKDKLQKIFEPFYEVEHEGRNRYRGTGIGLALSKGLVELHHGEISVENCEDGGSCFIVQLPLGNSHLSAAEMTEDEIINLFHPQVSGPQTIVASENPNKLNAVSKTNATTEKDAPLLLVIDDNPDIIEFIKSCFEGVYRIAEAADGKAGYAQAISHMPDLIISDVMMPEMDGIEFCEKIKGDLRTSHIPVILLTAKSSEENVMEGFETGADYYITKPFSEKLLQVRVRNLLQSRAKLKEYFSQNLEFYSDDKSIQSIDKKFIDRVIETIDNNLHNSELNVDSLGKELGLTRVHLYRKIKNLTGHTPSEFIRLVKLKKATEIMRNTELSVAEIAFKVGFETPSYFTKCFREHYKQTPSEYISQKM
ncbi:MAG: response regulator [Calditrichaeota bacterium]|nr:MAG: response regulator [Calditrichota bacterium]